MINVFLRSINDHKQKVDNLILRGDLSDFEHYRYLAGKSRGLQDAMEILRGLIETEGE